MIASDGPAHAGLFGALSDDRFAGALNSTGANEIAFLLEMRVLHPMVIRDEIVNLSGGLFRGRAAQIQDGDSGLILMAWVLPASRSFNRACTQVVLSWRAASTMSARR